jgi:hypothetical protein
MGITTVFDTHHYIKRLELAGVPESQAETHAEALATIFEDRIATKDDLKNLELHLKVDIIKWMIGLLLAQTTLLVSIFRLPVH